MPRNLISDHDRMVSVFGGIERANSLKPWLHVCCTHVCCRHELWHLMDFARTQARYTGTSFSQVRMDVNLPSGQHILVKTLANEFDMDHLRGLEISGWSSCGNIHAGIAKTAYPFLQSRIR